MNPMPTSSMHRPTSSGPSPISAPSASRTSAEPDWLVAARLPCLAITTPAPRATNAAAVETLMVPLASPPVPQVSTMCSGALTFSAKRRMARAKPTISPTDSPRTRRAVNKAAVTAGSTVPSMISSSARSASPAERGLPAATFPSVSRSKGLALQEVLQQLPAAPRQDALGVKLHALHGELFVPHAHDDAVFGPAGHGEALGHRIGLDDERVIACRLEALRQTPVHPLAVVQYPRGLAVHGLPAYDLAPVSLPYGLMTEANTQHRDPFRGLLEELQGDAGLVRCARTGRDDYSIRVERGDLLGRDLVVAPDEDLGLELPEVLDEVVRKGVVVVYNQNPHEPRDCSKEQTVRHRATGTNGSETIVGFCAPLERRFSTFSPCKPFRACTEFRRVAALLSCAGLPGGRKGIIWPVKQPALSHDR